MFHLLLRWVRREKHKKEKVLTGGDFFFPRFLGVHSEGSQTIVRTFSAMPQERKRGSVPTHSVKGRPKGKFGEGSLHMPEAPAHAVM